MRLRSLWSVGAAVVLIGVTATLAAAHDLFLKPDAFFVAPNASVRVTVLSGTFSSSEGSVAADRLLDLAVVGPGGRTAGDTGSWNAAGKASTWAVRVGEPGTWVLGASLRPRLITLAGADFNAYLTEDGVPDMLALRKMRGELARAATERYAKHVKALVQVGDVRTASFGTVLGYPAEVVPLDNPYEPGVKRMRVRILVDGKPVARQVVIAGGRTTSGGRIATQTVRADAQ
ncbi:MAG: DUF4198 domain-containing protein, partial [bacterium]